MKKYILYKLCILCFTCFTLTINAQDIKVKRFDKELYSYIDAPTESKARDLTANHQDLMSALSQTINSNSSDVPLDVLQKYFSHSTLKKIYKETINKFANLEAYEKELDAMATIAKRELRINRLPNYAVHVSGFKENSIYINNTISLSIDKYMGIDYAPYRGYFRPYQLQQMQAKMLTKDFTKAWLMADFIKTETTQGDMLFEMIEHGKLFYALSILLPQFSEDDLMAYSDSEFNWCIANEKKVWQSIVKKNHLYTTDKHIIYNYFNEDPQTSNSINGSPGQIGSWIGLQIVKQYAKEQKKSLLEIIKEDHRSILKESKYRP